MPNEAYPVQENWFKLIDDLGSEDAARAELIRQLRMFADKIESGKYPRVFGCECKNGADLSGEMMPSITVILSYPWGG